MFSKPPLSRFLRARQTEVEGKGQHNFHLQGRSALFLLSPFSPIVNSESEKMVQVHVAVLDTDVPCYPVYVKRGLYSSQFRLLLQAAAERLNQNLQPLKHGNLDARVTGFDVVGGKLPSLECLRMSGRDSYMDAQPEPIDAILVTGAAAAAYGDLFWIPPLQSFLQTVHAQFPLVKIFGSCFGHQLIAQALLGGDRQSVGEGSCVKVSVQPMQQGYELGVQPISLNPEFASRFLPFRHFLPSTPFRIQLIHGDAVVSYSQVTADRLKSDVNLPEPWINVGSSELCSIQGLYNPGRVLTLQGHFEFDAFATAELCHQFSRTFKWPLSLLTSRLDQIHRSSRPYGEDDDDSRVAAEVVLLFLAGED